MNRLEFIRQMSDNVEVSNAYKNHIFKKNYETFGRDKCLIFAIEEMSELQKELTKVLRGEGDQYGVLEEMADVFISMEYIRRAMGFEYDDLIKAETVKTVNIVDKKFDYMKNKEYMYDSRKGFDV